MSPEFRAAPQPNIAACPEQAICETFDYTPLTTEVVQQVRSAAQRIRCLVQRTLEDLLSVGQELLAVKETLPHGHFGPWLRAEFGWTERTARNFMAVAQRFGPKTEMISDLRMEATAAYLLAAPSAPEEASEIALRRAQKGEHITAAVAKDILGSLRNKVVRQMPQSPSLPAGKLLGQLLESLESFRQRWHPSQLSLLARQLREFADSLEGQTEPN
jgi:hypothetical protein